MSASAPALRTSFFMASCRDIMSRPASTPSSSLAWMKANSIWYGAGGSYGRSQPHRRANQHYDRSSSRRVPDSSATQCARTTVKSLEILP